MPRRADSKNRRREAPRRTGQQTTPERGRWSTWFGFASKHSDPRKDSRFILTDGRRILSKDAFDSASKHSLRGIPPARVSRDSEDRAILSTRSRHHQRKRSRLLEEVLRSRSRELQILNLVRQFSRRITCHTRRSRMSSLPTDSRNPARLTSRGSLPERSRRMRNNSI
jgi:hypothetical protein